MPLSPNLQPSELAALATAAKLEADGHKVTWQNVCRRISYVVHGKPHFVTSAVTDRVWVILTRMVKEQYRVELEKAHAAKKTTEEKARKAPGSVEVREQAALDCQQAMSDIGATSAMLPCNEERSKFERFG